MEGDRLIEILGETDGLNEIETEGLRETDNEILTLGETDGLNDIERLGETEGDAD